MIESNVIYFCCTIEHIPIHTHSDFLYLFETKPRNNEEYGYMKFGITESQSLKQRLQQYASELITPVNIYFIHTTKVSAKEKILKNLSNSHSLLKRYQGNEFFEGDINSLVNLFAFISLTPDERLLSVGRKNAETENLKLATLLNYSIIRLTSTIDYQTIESIKTMSFTKAATEPLVCPNCEQTFINKSGWSKHVKTCGKKKEHKCEYCNVVFSGASSLREHLKKCIEMEKYKREQEHKIQIESIHNDYMQKIHQLKEEHKQDIEKIKYAKISNQVNNSSPSEIDNLHKIIHSLEEAIKDKNKIISLMEQLIKK